MPRSGSRAAFLLLSPLLLLRAVLTVPLERGAPKEESPATESPVSGPALLSSQVFAVVLQFLRTPRGPLGGYSPHHTAWSLFVCHSLQSRRFDVVENWWWGRGGKRRGRGTDC